jgi:hypothetical protein
VGIPLINVRVASFLKEIQIVVDYVVFTQSMRLFIKN